MNLPRRAAVACLAVSAAAALTGAPAARAATAGSSTAYAVPASGVFTLQGHGWGHGHGMSQYGAYGAAKERGLDYRQILAFYYPHTTLTGQPMSTEVRVLLHDAGSHRLVVVPRAAGAGGATALTVHTDVEGVADCVLPATVDGTTAAAQWRTKVVDTEAGVRQRLQVRPDGGHWQQPKPPDCDRAWRHPLDGDVTFDDAGITQLDLGGSVRAYRGVLTAAFTGTRVYVVNRVRMESYLRSVVPSEMPSSWAPAALSAQAVAARTYASYGVAHPKNRPYYDVYDDTRDQMYVGVRGETAATDAAIAATQDDKTGTADVLLDGDGRPAFTQFSSSDGGWTVDGGHPYLPAQRDPYDGLVPSPVHTWRSTVSAAAIEAQFGDRIGSLRSLVVTGRDGNGAWGGRVTSMTLRGTSGSVSVSGATFRYSLGLRSEWFRVLTPPGPPVQVHAERTGGDAVTVSWQPPADPGTSPVRGYRVTVGAAGTASPALAQSVPADARSVTLDGAPAGGPLVATVVARSSAGRGVPARATTAVVRRSAGSRVATAVRVSRAGFAAGTADGAVLAARDEPGTALAAAPLSAAAHGPLLLTRPSSLSKAAAAELRRVLPAGRTVYLLGSTDVLGADVRSALVDLGYHVVRCGGATPARVARSVADRVAGLHDVHTVVEVAAQDPVAAWVAGAAAARRHAVVLLTSGDRQAGPTRRWLAAHDEVRRRFAVGAAAAAADAGARAVTAADPAALSVAVAQRFFRSFDQAAVVAPAPSTTGAVAAALAAAGRGPVLLPDGPTISGPAAALLGAARSALDQVALVGGGLPYDDVESRIQQALLG